MCNSKCNIRKLKICSNGAPNFNNMSKLDLKTFISCIELEIRDYYSNKKTRASLKVPP